MMNLPILVITHPLPSKAVNKLEELKTKYTLIYSGDVRAFSRQELLKVVKGACGVLCYLENKIDHEFINAAGPQLKVVSTMSVGYDHIDIKLLQQRGIAIGNTPDVLTEAVADINMALILMVTRRLNEAMLALKNGEWGPWRSTWMLGRQLSSQVVGIYGLGRVGIATIGRLRSFGVQKILYNSRQQRAEEETSYGIEWREFDQLIQESDIILINSSLNEQTRHKFNMQIFPKMKRDCILINTARGPIIHMDDLVLALKNNLVAAVGLDVTSPEPLPPNHPILDFKQCVVLPHIGSATVETRDQMALLAIDNLLLGVQSLPLKTAVKPS